MNRELRRSKKIQHHRRELMWVPIRGKETEIWGARSPDGKRMYNIRRERNLILITPDTWQALWAYKDDKIPNVITTRFTNRWDAQNVLEQIEQGFVVDPREVEEERKRLQTLSPDGWCFQGVFDGLSIWTYRPEENTTFVIINDIVRHPKQYSVSKRWFVEGNTKDTTKLRMESLGMYDSLPAAKQALKRLSN